MVDVQRRACPFFDFLLEHPERTPRILGRDPEIALESENAVGLTRAGALTIGVCFSVMFRSVLLTCGDARALFDKSASVTERTYRGTATFW